jgi:putative intracellular protease/amidase
MNDTIKNSYYEKIAEAKKNDGKIVRICAGTYILFKNGERIGIEQIDDGGDFKNWWVVDCYSIIDSQTIKVRTLKEAKQVALNYNFQPHYNHW